MRIYSLLLRILLGIILVIALYEVNARMSDVEIVKTAQKALITGTEVLTKIDKYITPIKAFAKISGFMCTLGPAAMAVSAILSIVIMFLPKEDSPELKALKEGFAKVNNKLDIITSKIGNLENIIELSSAKSAFINSITAIDSNYEALEEARKSDNKDNYRFFAKQYENTFALATDKIYDSLIGSHGSMGFDIVNLYKIHVKCNPQLLSEFCTKGLQLIVQGMDVEGAYMGYHNFSEKAEEKAATWKPKMEALTKHCSVRIEECENNWKTYAYQQFREVHREIGGNNQAFADRLAKELDSVAPQRSWLTVIYNDAGGFGPHTFSSLTTYEVEKIWHDKDHCATVVSIEKQPPLIDESYNDLVKVIQERQRVVESINDCKTTANWLIVVNRYQDNDARFIVEKIRESYFYGFINAVRMDYNPGFVATGGTLYTTELKWQCTASPFKLIVFQ